VIALIVVYQSRFGIYQELSITTTTLPDATYDKPYGPTRIEANGGTPPLVWDITPALPAGLSLDHNSGVISGTPKGVSAKTSYTITVIDSATPPISAFKKLSFEVKQ
jgi:Putative Ig domain